MSSISIAIIGTGNQGRRLAFTCKQLRNIHIEALCDIWPYNLNLLANRLDPKHKPRLYNDLYDLLETEKGIDACIIASPDFLHAEHSIACMKTGLHVYCETPMAHSEHEARKMIDIASQTQRKLQIGYQRRSNPRYVFAVESLVHGREIIGETINIHGYWNLDVKKEAWWKPSNALAATELRRNNYDTMDHLRNWRKFPQYSSGLIGQLVSHQLDVSSWAFKTDAYSAIGSGDGNLNDSSINILEYKTQAGTRRSAFHLNTKPSFEGYFEEFRARNGYIKMSNNPKYGNEFRKTSNLNEQSRRSSRGSCPPKPGSYPIDSVIGVACTCCLPPIRGIGTVQIDDPYLPHLENFFSSIQGAEKLSCPGSVGLNALKAAQLCARAIKTHQKVIEPEHSPYRYVAQGDA